MRIPLLYRLPFFFDALLLLSFGLKFICPLDSGCFTDPLVQLSFWPLFLVEGKEWFSFSVGQEIVFLLIFWFLAGALLGSVLDLFKREN